MPVMGMEEWTQVNLQNMILTRIFYLEITSTKNKRANPVHSGVGRLKSVATPMTNIRLVEVFGI